LSNLASISEAVDEEKKRTNVITLDEKTFEVFNIPVSFELVRKNLICSFISCDEVESKEELLEIRSIEKKEITTIFQYSIPVSKMEKSVRKLVLSSANPMGRLVQMPCPFYKFSILLTEDEYELCKKLAPTTKFILKDVKVE
jgi:hypothetical protein